MAKLLKIKTGATTTTDDIVVKKAEQLKTARTINGVPFDGTEDITISIGQAGDAVTLGGYLPDEANTAETVVVRDVNKNINVTSVSADWVQLNTATEFLGITEVPGKIFFDETHDTLAIVTNNGDVIEVGEDLYMPLVKNNSGVAIPKGYLVMATGSNGDKINVAKAITNGTISFDYIIGVATTDIPNGSELGRVITQGYIKGINTNAWDIGTVLYADPNSPGWWTSTKPELPNYTTATAFVVKKNSSSGIIMVRLYPFNIGVGGGSTSVTVSETAPTESTNGDLWFNSNEGILNVFYADADSSQWVTINDLSKLNIENWEEAYSWGNHLEVGYKINTTNISDNQPNDPKHGDLWFNSFSSNLFMYYVDEDSSQWIQLNNVSDLDLENFNEAYSWGNHAEAGYLSTSNLLNLNTSIIPLNDNTIDLGSPTKKFRELYLSGSTLFIGSLAIKDNNGEIEFQRNNNGTMVAANIKNEIDFTTIKNRPTTLSGLGITDAVTLGTHSNTAFRGDHGLLAYNHSQVSDGTNPHATTFANIASKPTTISGFGITDAVTDTRTINGFNLQSNIILTNDHIDIVSETITSSVTLNINNKNRILKVNSSSAITLNIPSNASVPFPINTEVAIIREGSGTVSIAPGSGVTLLSTDSKRKIKGQYSSAALLKTASDTWLLIGSIEV
jgi:hypothetical protein